MGTAYGDDKRDAPHPDGAPSRCDTCTADVTAWSVVLAAGATDSRIALPALQQLCSRYWYPLYSYVRRQGCDATESEDVTQSFFASLLERNAFQGLDPARGRFRTFLLAALRNHMSNLRAHDRALKRGGGQSLLSLDTSFAEDRFALEPRDTSLTPERAFDRQWALTLLDRAFARLRGEYERSGRGALLDALQPTLTGDKVGGGYAGVAGQLGMTEGAVKVAAHRLRIRYREVLQEEAADTTGAADEAMDELRTLLTALAG